MGEGEGEKSSLLFRFHLSPFPQKRLILRLLFIPLYFYAIRIHNGFYRFTDIGQSFHKVKKN